MAISTLPLQVETLRRRIAGLQARITANYHTRTDEVLAGLGRMYVADERFKKNVGRYGGGTAEFAAETREIYARGKCYV